MTDFGVYINAQKVYINNAKVYINAQKVYINVTNSRGKCALLISIIGINNYTNRFSLAIGSFKHETKQTKNKPKSKPFNYGKKTKHALARCETRSLRCTREARGECLTLVEYSFTVPYDRLDALRAEVDSRWQPADREMN